MAVDPVRQILAERGVGEGVGAGAEHGDEQRSGRGLAGFAVVNRDRWSGPVDEHLLAGSVVLPQHDILIPVPALIQLAEAAVAVAVRLASRYSSQSSCRVRCLCVCSWLWSCAEIEARPRGTAGVIRPRGKQQFVQPPVVVIVRQRPAQTGGGSSFQIPVNGRLTDGATSGDLVLPQTQTESQTKTSLIFRIDNLFWGNQLPPLVQWRRLGPRCCPAPPAPDEVLFRKSFRGCE